MQMSLQNNIFVYIPNETAALTVGRIGTEIVVRVNIDKG